MGVIDVASYFTGGDGSPAAPWSLDWAILGPIQRDTEYVLPSGEINYPVAPNLLKSGVALVGRAGTVLRCTGPGDVLVLDNPGGAPLSYDNWTMNVRLENLLLRGNAASRHGLFMRGVRNALVSHVGVADVPGAGIWTEACVTNELRNFRCTHHEMPNDAFAVRPAYGIVFAARGPDTSTTWTVTNPVIEGVGSIGIWVKDGCYGNTFINGTSEGNLGKGMQIDSWDNVVMNTDFEANGATDVELNHDRNKLVSIYSGRAVVINPSQMNCLDGGIYTDITIHPYSHMTRVAGLLYRGTFTDGPLDTIKYGNQSLAEGQIKQSFIGSPQEQMQQLTPVNGAVTLNVKAGTLYWMGLFGDVTLNLVNGFNGGKVTVRIRQDTVGGRVLTIPQAETPPPINPAPNSYTYLEMRWNTQINKWQFV